MHRRIRLSAVALCALGAALFGTSAYAQAPTQITVTTQFLTTAPGSASTCNAAQTACAINVSGIQSSTPGGNGSYQILLNVQPRNVTRNSSGQTCVATSGTTTLSFPAHGGVPASGLVLSNTSLCYSSGDSLSGAFSIASSSGIFAGAQGNGSVSVGWNPITGVFSFNDSSLTYPAPGGGSGSGSGGGLGGGGLLSTPELGSLALLGSGLLGLAGYGYTRLRGRLRSTSAG